MKNIGRRERLRRLAFETIDLNSDPYFMKNHTGQYECKLCLTMYLTEGSYLSHSQLYLTSLDIKLKLCFFWI